MLVSASGYGATMMVTVTVTVTVTGAGAGAGAGTDSCQSWTDSIKTGGTEKFVYKTWVDGHLTGFNMSTILKN